VDHRRGWLIELGRRRPRQCERLPATRIARKVSPNNPVCYARSGPLHSSTARPGDAGVTPQDAEPSGGEILKDAKASRPVCSRARSRSGQRCPTPSRECVRGRGAEDPESRDQARDRRIARPRHHDFEEGSPSRLSTSSQKMADDHQCACEYADGARPKKRAARHPSWNHTVSSAREKFSSRCAPSRARSMAHRGPRGAWLLEAVPG